MCVCVRSTQPTDPGVVCGCCLMLLFVCLRKDITELKGREGDFMDRSIVGLEAHLHGHREFGRGVSIATGPICIQSNTHSTTNKSFVLTVRAFVCDEHVGIQTKTSRDECRLPLDSWTG